MRVRRERTMIALIMLLTMKRMSIIIRHHSFRSFRTSGGSAYLLGRCGYQFSVNIREPSSVEHSEDRQCTRASTSWKRSTRPLFAARGRPRAAFGNVPLLPWALAASMSPWRRPPSFSDGHKASPKPLRCPQFRSLRSFLDFRGPKQTQPRPPSLARSQFHCWP